MWGAIRKESYMTPLPEKQDEQAKSTTAAAVLSRRKALQTGAAGLVGLLNLSHITPALAAELKRLAGERPMTGARLAAILQEERARWNALVALVRPERMEVSGVEGDWSVKDLIAHLSWYERAVVEGAQQILTTGTFTRRRGNLSLDENNVEIAAASRGRSVTEVQDEAAQVFAQLLAVVNACPDQLLNDPKLLGLPDDLVPWMAIANNSYAHYREHEPALQAWLSA
jgi:DinB superfamily